MRPDDAARHAARRARALERLGDGALILPAAPELRVGRDLELRYVPDPELYYLTGYEEPGAVGVLCRSHDEAPFTLFVRPRDAEAETWTGVRGGPEAALERYGADAAHPIAELEERLPTLVQDAERLYFRLGGARPRVERAVHAALERGRSRRPRHGRGPVVVADPGLVLDDLRVIKDDDEIDRLRRAAHVTGDGIRDGLAAVRPGGREGEVEAAIEAGFRRRGADGPAFATIVAAGANATVLHYVANRDGLEERQLLLIDAGARARHYAGDISRTVAVGGRLDDERRELHQAVDAARAAAIAAVRPGATIEDVSRAALRVLLEAMREHGLVDAPVDELLERPDDWKPWYPHKVSHWLGLDVHDPGDYVRDGESRRLEPGMVLTVEPGLYVPDRDDAPERLRGTGIRIEDDVVVTATGHEVLTAGLPTSLDALRG